MSPPKKIAIIGPESTGKSQLAQQLATHFNTTWVPEYAREYLDSLDRDYEKADLLEIAKTQLQLEDEFAQSATDFLFCDTTLIVIKVWSDHSYGESDPWILDQLKARTYDFYLLTDIDLPWQPDPMREHPDMRNYFFARYHDYLKDNHLPFGIVSSLGDERLASAISIVKAFSRDSTLPASDILNS